MFGLKTVALWSLNNENYSIKQEQLIVREYILDDGIIPDDYQVLIINGAYETGINIKDEDIEIVIINSTNSDTIIQARSRVRKDIELLMYKVPRAERTDIPKITVPSEYLERKLITKEKKELIKLLDIKDNRGRLMGWINFKKILFYNNYDVIDNQRITIESKRKQASIIIDKICNRC